MKRTAPRTIWLKDYKPSTYLVETVHLDVVLHAQRTRIRSSLALKPNPAAAKPGGPLVLDGELFTLESLAIDGHKLGADSYRFENGVLTVQQPPVDAFELETVTILDPSANKALQGLYQSNGVYCTQCEAEGFRRITFMLDRPDVLAKYTVRLEADINEAPVLLANGNLQERGRLNGDTHYAVWHDPYPKPCYLFAMVAGDLGSIASNFTTKSDRHVDLRIYVEHGREPRAAWAMDCLKRAMAWDETRFGREYDLEQFNIVAVSDFNMGAMENKGLNIFNDRLILASADTATDAQFEAIESVVAHEYFHNWTGNRITCRDWFQLCLKEGLTVYRDQEFSSDERSATVQRIIDVRQLKATQFPEDAGPLAHPVRPASYIEINNFYTATVYEKGAELVRMLATLLGQPAFRAGMDLYFDRWDGQAATIEDFIACFETASSQDLTQFKQWYYQSGTPHLDCSFKFDKAAGTLDLALSQRFSKTAVAEKRKPVPIPVRFGLLGADGLDQPAHLADLGPENSGLLVLDQAENTFQFTGLKTAPVVSFLRGFSAPVIVSIDYSDADLAFLAAHDPDFFNRWQAGQTFAIRTLLRIYAALKAGKRSSRGAAFAKTIGRSVFDDTLDAAYRAEVLRLPSVGDLMREIGTDVDPALAVKAHRQLSASVATALQERLERLYASLQTKTAYSPDAKSAGRRALRNTVLTLLSVRGTEENAQRVSNHYFFASNMTDQAHALQLIAHVATNKTERVFQHFRAAWQHDHLVMDLWFAARALSTRVEALDDVRDLLADPLFSITTPNKVRALLTTFATANPLNFHRADGAGYAFIAEQVLVIDRFNPQVASRLVSSFRIWRTLEPGRRAHAKATLAMLASANLSRDVAEIVAKMVGD